MSEEIIVNVGSIDDMAGASRVEELREVTFEEASANSESTKSFRSAVTSTSTVLSKDGQDKESTGSWKARWLVWKGYIALTVQTFCVNIPDLLQHVCFTLLLLLIFHYAYSTTIASHEVIYDSLGHRFENLAEEKLKVIYTLEQLMQNRQILDIDIYNASSITEYEKGMGYIFWNSSTSVACCVAKRDRDAIQLHNMKAAYFATQLRFFVNSTYGYKVERRRNKATADFSVYSTTKPSKFLFDPYTKNWFNDGLYKEEPFLYGPVLQQANDIFSQKFVATSFCKKIYFPDSTEYVVINLKSSVEIFDDVMEIIPSSLHAVLVSELGTVMAWKGMDEFRNGTVLPNITQIQEFRYFKTENIFDGFFQFAFYPTGFFRVRKLPGYEIYLVSAFDIWRAFQENLSLLLLLVVLLFLFSMMSVARIFTMLVVFIRFKFSYFRNAQLAILEDVLPASFAKRVASRNVDEVVGDLFPSTTVVFIDIVNFSEMAGEFPPYDLLEYLNKFFSELDELSEKFGMTKIKTIGDAYLAVCGCPEESEHHATNSVLFARSVLKSLKSFNKKYKSKFSHTSVRIGIHSGPIVAGVVGEIKMVFDIWGQTVNLAERIQVAAKVDSIFVSSSTYGHMDKEMFETEYLGVHTFDNVEIEVYRVVK